MTKGGTTVKRFTRTALLACAAWLVGTMAASAADLSIWGLQTFNTAADEYIGTMVKDFGKTAGIDAEYVVVPANVLNQRLAAAFEAHTPPDAFMQGSGAIQFYISRGLTVPIDDVLAEMRKVPGGIYENLVSAGAWQGTIQAVPLEVDTTPMFVRKDLLDEIGKPVPTTWDELRADALLIQKKHPQISGFGMTVSNSNDAEAAIRIVMWCFGAKVMAADGKTVVFDSPETRAAYQFVADMFLKDRTIPRSALTWDDAGNNVAYQTGRAAFVINPPSIYQWLQQNDKKLLASTLMVSVPKGPGPNGMVGNAGGDWTWSVSKDSKHQDQAKAWLKYFYDPVHYKAVVEKVGGRWVPVYPAMMKTIALFANDPAYAQFDTLARTSIIDGYAGPPNALSGKVWDATILTKALQKVLVDGVSVADAVQWGQQQIEALAKQ
jgi:multiple sugar transport system substrate-binding protein